MERGASRTAFAAAAVLSLSAVKADIAYDAVTGLPVNGTLIGSDTEWAQAITLAPGSSLALSEVHVLAWNASATTVYTAMLTITFYAPGASPGAVIGRRQAVVTVPPQLDTLVTVPFTGVALPSAECWVSWNFQSAGSVDIAGSDETFSDPVVGTNARHTARRPMGQNVEWLVQPTPTDPFMLQIVTGAVCYANCDGSTAPPVLNANDFQCFLNAFASGDAYANCDGSTIPPVLNVNDFQCFLNTFAAGCT